MDKVLTVSGRVASGVAGLDEVLGGGFVPQTAILVKGQPGTGKTVLGLQFAASGALEHAEPCILASFEAFPDHLHRDALALGWDLRALENRGMARVLFLRRDDLTSGFAERESMAVSRITDAAMEIGAKRVFVDSATRFWHLPLADEQRQHTFQDFVLKVKGLGVTLMMAADEEPGAGAVLPAEMHSDIVIALRRESPPGSAAGPAAAVHTLEVLKARAQPAAPGRHPYIIGPRGAELWPVPPLAGADGAQPIADAAPVATGVRGLDALLGGGYPAGGAVLIAGLSGAGKSALARAFCAASRGAGRGVLLAASQLSAGSPADVTVDPGACRHPLEYFHAVRAAWDAADARDLVLDGLPLFRMRPESADAWEALVLAPLARLVAAAGGVLLVTAQCGAPDPVHHLGASPLTPRFDTVLCPGYGPGAPASRRLTIVKSACPPPADATVALHLSPHPRVEPGG